MSPTPVVTAPTGLKQLDRLTSGLMPHTLWVIAGTPSVGRTVLASQIALHAALAGVAVAIMSGRDPHSTVRDNMTSALACVPALTMSRERCDPEQMARLTSANEELATTKLTVLDASDRLWPHVSAPGLLPLPLMVKLPPPVDVLVLDDADSLLELPFLEALPWLRQCTRTWPGTLLLTVPEEQVLSSGVSAPTLRRESDVALRLTRADLFDLNSPRLGTADIEVLRHRDGPVGTVEVVFQGHYRRFVDFAE